jgi:lupus La protein
MWIFYSYPKGLILAFKLKKIPADSGTDQNGVEKVDDAEGAKKEESSTGNEEKAPEGEGDVTEEQSDGVEMKGMAAGETTQSVDKDDKSPSENDEDTISREDIKEEFTKFGIVRVIYIFIPSFILFRTIGEQILRVHD